MQPSSSRDRIPPASHRAERNLSHNTSDQVVTIHYPFHPLVGQRVSPVMVRTSPLRAFVVRRGQHRLTVPAWMTEPAFADLRVAPDPRVSVEALLQVVSALGRARQGGLPRGIMAESPGAEEGHPDGEKRATTTPSCGARRAQAGRAAARRCDQGGTSDGNAVASDLQGRTRPTPRRRGGRGGGKR